jgi:4-amino-4-deoxy-L-arabinose transferase-like glycosyltransferase
MLGLFDRRDAWLFALIFAALLARLALSAPIWQHGEAREGLVVWGIVHNNEWILPFRNGELPSKPPLFHWLAALCALILGMHDFAVRLPSALAAEVLAVTTFLVGRAAGHRTTGWLSVGALLGMYEFWDSGTQARVDMLFSACVAVSLAGFFFWYRDRRDAARAVCYVAAALAVLSKGPAGVLLPALVIGAFLAAQRELRLLANFWSWPLVLGVSIVDLGWYAWAYQVGGNEFLQLQILRENFDRALGLADDGASHNYLASIFWLASRTAPWSLALVWSAVCRSRGEREDAAGRFLHSWWIVVLVVFTLAVGKRAVYLLPLYPAIAVLAARAMGALAARWSREQPDHRRESRLAIPLFVRRLASARTVFAALIICDLTLMLADRDFWRDTNQRRARLAFVAKIGATLPPRQPLAASPELDKSLLIVIAYRLRREIERKPIATGARNEFFVVPLDSPAYSKIKARLLVWSEIDRIGLLRLLSRNPSR